MRLYALIGLIAVLGVGSADASNSLRCGSRLVAVGDVAATLLGACGEPTLRDVWSPSGAYGPGALAGVEQWTYNFGSSQLLRVVRLRQGRVERIDAEGYGFPQGAARDCSASAAIFRGMSKYRLLARCGEPLTRVADHLLAPAYPDDAYWGWGGRRADYLEPVYREEWTYNFGSAKLLRIITLDNGKVTDVQTGARGFNP